MGSLRSLYSERPRNKVHSWVKDSNSVRWREQSRGYGEVKCELHLSRSGPAHFLELWVSGNHYSRRFQSVSYYSPGELEALNDLYKFFGKNAGEFGLKSIGIDVDAIKIKDNDSRIWEM